MIVPPAEPSTATHFIVLLSVYAIRVPSGDHEVPVRILLVMLVLIIVRPVPSAFITAIELWAPCINGCIVTDSFVPSRDQEGAKSPCS